MEFPKNGNTAEKMEEEVIPEAVVEKTEKPKLTLVEDEKLDGRKYYEDLETRRQESEAKARASIEKQNKQTNENYRNRIRTNEENQTIIEAIKTGNAGDFIQDLSLPGTIEAINKKRVELSNAAEKMSFFQKIASRFNGGTEYQKFERKLQEIGFGTHSQEVRNHISQTSNVLENSVAGSYKGLAERPGLSETNGNKNKDFAGSADEAFREADEKRTKIVAELSAQFPINAEVTYTTPSRTDADGKEIAGKAIKAVVVGYSEDNKAGLILKDGNRKFAISGDSLSRVEIAK